MRRLKDQSVNKLSAMIAHTCLPKCSQQRTMNFKTIALRFTSPTRSNRLLSYYSLFSSSRKQTFWSSLQDAGLWLTQAKSQTLSKTFRQEELTWALALPWWFVEPSICQTQSWRAHMWLFGEPLWLALSCTRCSWPTCSCYQLTRHDRHSVFLMMALESPCPNAATQMTVACTLLITLRAPSLIFQTLFSMYTLSLTS